MTTLTVAGVVPEWTLADRLRKAREVAGMSQTALGEVVGISRRSISSYESGEARPKRPQLVAWALATGVPLWWLEGSSPDGGLPRLDSNQQPSGYPLPQVARLHLVAVPDDVDEGGEDDVEDEPDVAAA